MYEAYFTTLERRAVRFENVASKLEDEDKRGDIGHRHRASERDTDAPGAD